MTPSARTPILAGLLTLAWLVVGLGGWGALASISGAVLAPGRIEVLGHRQLIQHPDGGVIDVVLVKEGEIVARGQPILRLDGTRPRAELAMTDTQYFEILARIGRLEAERDGAPQIQFHPDLLARAARDGPVAAQVQGQRTLFSARTATLAGKRQQLAERILQIESQLSGLKAQILALEQQGALIAQELTSKRRLLDQGLAQAPAVMALEREAARLKGQGGELVAATAQARGRITETRLEILDLEAGRREAAVTELRDLGVQVLQLAERRGVLADQIARLTVTAPVAGVIYGLKAMGAQSVLRPADVIAQILPEDQPLIAAVNISPNDIDALHLGQIARLRLTAFSARTTPELRGEVTQVSADALEDTRTGQGYFRVEIALAKDPPALPGGGRLVPGMPVEAMVTTAPRPAISYLLKPVTDYLTRAFRED